MQLFKVATSSLALVSAVLATPAFAQAPETTRPELLARLVACRAVLDTVQRLACYDASSLALDAAEREGDVVVIDRAQATAARRQLFGFEVPSLPSLFERGPTIEDIGSIESALVRATRTSENRWVFTLEDASVWRQIDTDPVRFQSREGEPVRVRRAALGSYLLVVGNSRAVRVRRQ